MDFPLDHQKICQIDTRRLLFLMTTIASFILLVQFLSIPYGNVLQSLFASGKVPSIGKSDQSVAEFFPNSEVIFAVVPFNNSISSNSSVPHVLVKNIDESVLGEFTDQVDEGKVPYRNSEVNVNFELENEFSPVEADESSRTDSIRVKASEPGRISQAGHVPFDNVQKEGNALTLERNRIEYNDSIPFTPALSPVAPLTNLTLQRKVDANLTSSVISGTSNLSSLGEQEADTPSKDKKLQTKRTVQVTSKNKSAVSTHSIERGSLDMPSKPVMSLSEMNLLLQKNRASSRSMIPRWSSVRDQEILSAKLQIENPPIIKTDRELYAPLFWNISMFKRSYELMERTLKVYTYREGARPVFHQPETKGIYASEGWFMKQMEGNKKFSVKDPRKAHLFYFPFSARRLEQFLYVPNSHNHKNLIEHLKKYLDLISAKYPFWNRTGGADHFLVGCHDWTPTETKRYMSSCIRALCNADVNEGFTLGKDASLPETYVRLAKDPLRDLGGKAPSKRQILAFFAGSMHGYLRPILLQYWENKDPDMKIYSHMGHGKTDKGIYVQHMKNSKYCICAKGFEVNSPRVVEAIFYECVPVIISDNFVPPFFEVLNWETFAVFIPEKDIPNLKNILLSIPEEKYQKLQMRVKKVQQHFLWHTKPVKYDIFHMILHSIWYNRVFQINPR
ncbi:Xylogalacturonan beta-1,3-xylosyltransferase [Thalictrum thalictroides]|uniref:Xylogalacturonan beta-1,3-xylosyltransferase n=1 Tax=Thalictrum thalictroides TaxID=46969 RepID=A0A7J6UWX4_THATH|nr:Xylogalacturonan beta-1,3-xylosyltransferase [Thalictrum thalictroides]